MSPQMNANERKCNPYGLLMDSAPQASSFSTATVTCANNKTISVYLRSFADSNGVYLRSLADSKGNV
jgi:hypothetical protein